MSGTTHDTQPVEPTTLLQRLFRASRDLASSRDVTEIGRALMRFAASGDVHFARMLLFSDELDGRPTTIELREGWTIDDRPTRPYGIRLPLADYSLFEFMHADSLVICQDVTQDDRLNEPARNLMAASGLGSFATIPLTAGQNWLGVLIIGRDTPSAYTEELIYAWWTLAGQAAAAMENEELFAQVHAALTETEKQAQRLTILTEMSKELSQAESLDAIFQIAAEKTDQLLASDRVSIALLDASGDVLNVLTLQGEQGTVPLGTQGPVAGSSIELAIKENRLVSVSEAPETDLGGIRSFLVVPLFIGGRVNGTLNVGSKRPHAYTSRDGDLVQQIASILSSAIENKRLLEQTEQQLADLKTIQAAISALTSTFSLDDAAAALLPHVASAVRADMVSMFLVDGAQLTRIGIYPPSEGDEALLGQTHSLSDYPLTQKVIETRQPLALRADDTRLQAHAREAFKAAGVTASATVPLVGREGVLGTLAVSLHQPGRAITEQELGLLKTLADQATIVFERIRLFKQTQTSSVQLQTAAEISRAASSILDPDDLMRQAVNLVRDSFDLYYVGLFLADETGDWAILRAATGKAGQVQLQQGHKLEIGGDSMIGWCMANARARISLDVADERVRFVNPLLPETRSEMALPLSSRGRVIGAMTIQSVQDNAFSQDDISALQTMADQLANAIHNARLFEDQSQRAQELATLNLIAAAVSRSIELQDLLADSLEAVIAVMDFDAGLISLIDSETGHLYQACHKGLPEPMVNQFEKQGLGGTLCDIVYQSGESLAIGDIKHSAPADVSGLIQHGIFAYIGSPLKYQTRALGTLCLFSRSAHDMTAAQLSLLEAMGRQIGIGIENARLFKETQTQARREQALRQTMATINASEDLLTSLPAITVQLRQLVPIDALTLTSYTPGEKEFTLLAIGAEPEGGHFARRGLRSPLKDSAPGWVITHKTPWIDTDFRQSLPFASDRSLVAEGLVSRLLLPVKIGEQVIGTLNMASKQPAAFTKAHLPMLTQVADQMALALERARLLDQTRAALAEVQATHQRYLREEWEGLLSAHRDRVWSYMDGPDGLTAVDELWTPEIEKVIGTGELAAIQKPDAGDGGSLRSGLAIPIRLMGQTIGVLDFFDQEHNWTQDDQMLVEALADQVALALENQRLFEQTQRRAHREHLISEIVGKIRAGSDVQSILQTAAEELGRVLGVSRTVIRLGIPGDGSHSVHESESSTDASAFDKTNEAESRPALEKETPPAVKSEKS